MRRQTKQTGLRLAVITSAVILALVIIWAVVRPTKCRHHQFESPLDVPSQNIEIPEKTGAGETEGKVVIRRSTEPLHEEHRLEISAENTAPEQEQINMKDVIESAISWSPVFTFWFGRPAPDFTITDIYGKEHKLSDYRGRDVIVVFWATWCPPCLVEIPHLIRLRELVGENKLAILAISNENTVLLKKFADNRKINYTVSSRDSRTLPSPFSRVNSIPSTFFIDPDGMIKLAVVGAVPIESVKSILRAK